MYKNIVFQLYKLNNHRLLVPKVREWLKNLDFRETRFCWITPSKFIRF